MARFSVSLVFMDHLPLLAEIFFSLKFSNQNQQLTSFGLSAEILTLLSLIKTRRTHHTIGKVQGMLQFRELISDLGLIDIPLRGRRFTWSNARTDPSMTKLDRFLISAECSS
jgi:hypothetical protein